MMLQEQHILYLFSIFLLFLKCLQIQEYRILSLNLIRNKKLIQKERIYEFKKHH